MMSTWGDVYSGSVYSGCSLLWIVYNLVVSTLDSAGDVYSRWCLLWVVSTLGRHYPK